MSAVLISDLHLNESDTNLFNKFKTFIHLKLMASMIYLFWVICLKLGLVMMTNLNLI